MNIRTKLEIAFAVAALAAVGAAVPDWRAFVMLSSEQAIERRVQPVAGTVQQHTPKVLLIGANGG